MSLANRKRQYKMFMERGEVALAEDQIKGHPGIIEETKPVEEPVTKSKGKK